MCTGPPELVVISILLDVSKAWDQQNAYLVPQSLERGGLTV